MPVYSKEDIERINRTRSGVEGQEYEDVDGNKYIGIRNGWLTWKDKAENTTFEPTDTIEATNAQGAVEEVMGDVVEVASDLAEAETEIEISITETLSEAKCFAIAMSLIL